MTHPLETALEIAGARLFEVAVPLATPFRIPGGTMAVRRSLIVELTDRSGARGYGESAPFERPFYSEETLDSARACLAGHLVPALSGRAFPGLEAAALEVASGVRGNRFARAGIETALWDLVCCMSKTPLRGVVARVLERFDVSAEFRVSSRTVQSGAALGMPDPDDPSPLQTMADWASQAVKSGVRRIKVKVQPGWDVEPVRAVRQAAGPAVAIWADANGSYDRDHDLDRLRALDREGLEMLEQPLHPDDLLGTLGLEKEIGTPVCVDESLVDDNAARLLLALGGPRIWNLKVQRVGGLWESVRIYKRAVEASVRLWGGTMPETGVGTHAIVSLGCFAGFTHPTDATASSRWYRDGADLVDFRMDELGRVAVNGVPGLAHLGLDDKLAGAKLVERWGS